MADMALALGTPMASGTPSRSALGSAAGTPSRSTPSPALPPLVSSSALSSSALSPAAPSSALSSAPGPSRTPSGFVLPALHAFPPFFTPQPNAATWASQAAHWSRLIRAWCAHHRVWHLDAAGSWERAGADGLLRSTLAGRSLSEAATRRVLEVMVSEGESCCAVWRFRC
jgi:hypothetical protein